MANQNMIKFPRYERYKDSGVDWIGEIPEHWDFVKLKYLVLEHSGNGFPVELQGNKHSELAFLKVSDISASSKIISRAENYVSFKMAKDRNWNIVPIGSIVTAKIGEALKKNHRKILGREAIIDNNCIGIESININSEFNYFLHQKIDFNWFVNPGAVPSISVSKYKNFFVAFPPFAEQTAIAQFLDHKTAQIDRAIAIKEEQIKLLNERKQIMIQEAVTKGLDSSVPMKDSGVEWIGEIPEHWGVLPGLRFFSENKKKNIGMVETQVLSLSYGNIIVRPPEKLTGLVPESFETYQIIRPDYIVIRGTDLQNDKTSLRIGFVQDKGIITSAYLAFKTLGSHNPKYLYLFLHVLDITKAIYRYGSGLRQNLSFEDFKRLPVLNVPLEEQNKIVRYIEEYSKYTEQTINHLKEELLVLKEYKTTLINEAVTGKIKVN